MCTPRGLLDELFGPRGTLRAFDEPALRERVLARWKELRPIGERLDRELEQRARSCVSKNSSVSEALRRAPDDAHRLAGRHQREAA